jgi:hypothetical protein
MFRKILHVIAVAGFFAVACFGASPKTKCQNIPITITFDQSTGMRIYGDGNNTYDAEIYCDQSWMVQLNLMTNNQRKFTVDLRTPAQVNPGYDVPTPVGVAAEQKTANYMKITHFLDSSGQPRTDTFTTKLGVGGFTVGRQGYSLRYYYEPADGDPITPEMLRNKYDTASMVSVEYHPGASGEEFWVVAPIPVTASHPTVPRVCDLATLFSGTQNVGQFDVPFKITIRRR